jgi:hypothetical protein
MPRTRHRWIGRAAGELVSAAASAHIASVDRASRDASLTLGLTAPTDTVLYLLLPLYPEVFGVSLAEAGLLLAANRLVRIAGYRWVMGFYERRGPRASCIAATVGAAISSCGYAFAPDGVVVLLLARLVWGLAFAAMNIAVQALPTAEHAGMARRSGRSRATIAGGQMLGILAAAAMAPVIGPRMVFLVLGAVALLALPIAIRLPNEHGQQALDQPLLALPSRLDIWSFVQGAALDGLFVMGLAVLAREVVPARFAIAAGAAMALRYGAEITLGAPSGMLAERFGATRLMVTLSCGSALGLAAMGLGALCPGALWLGAVSVVVLRGLIQPLPAPVAAALNPGPGRVRALTRLATWRDLGAAVGPLVAGALLPIVATFILYGTMALLLAVAALAMREGSPPSAK